MVHVDVCLCVKQRHAGSFVKWGIVWCFVCDVYMKGVMQGSRLMRRLSFPFCGQNDDSASYSFPVWPDVMGNNTNIFKIIEHYS